MHCPHCGYDESKVVDSRSADEDTAIRRRRECLSCGHRFTTYERMGENPIVVIKADGSSEAFNRDKLFRGLLIACAKRPVSSDRITQLIDSLEAKLRYSQCYEVSSKEIGELVLKSLADVDDVAYVRFASVYKDFKSVDEFAAVLTDLKRD